MTTVLGTLKMYLMMIMTPMWARASLFRRFTDTSVYGTGSVKMWNTRHKISVNIRTALARFVVDLLYD